MSTMKLTAAQENTLHMLEREHKRLADYMCGGGWSKEALFVDFDPHSESYRCYRIAQDGSYTDATDAMLLVEEPFDADAS